MGKRVNDKVTLETHHSSQQIKCDKSEDYQTSEDCIWMILASLQYFDP